MTSPTTDAPTTAPDTDEELAPPDHLEQLAQRLGAVDELPVEERATVFEEVNRALVTELNALEEL